MPTILVVGKGSSGSWKIRGEQLGQAIGATVKPMATLDDCRRADLIVAVKRLPSVLLEAIKRSGRPWVWDVVDAYPQPRCHNWTLEQARDWMQAELRAKAPTAVVWPTRAMGEDVRFGGHQMWLPHHARPGQRLNPVRQVVRVVGYEGSPAYIAELAPMIEQECERRGWRFVVNPVSFDSIDIVLAMRGPSYDSIVARRWKSNVKLANAHGTGTPFIGARERGYLETAAGCEYWAHDRRELGIAFDWLADVETRQHIHDAFVSRRLMLDTVAAEYRQWLETLV